MAARPAPATTASADPSGIVAELAPYLRIAHQIPGRVRLKLDAAALDQPRLREIGGARLQAVLGALAGVRDTQFNLMARSCVIAYDNAVIPDAAWPDLLAGRPSAAAAKLLELLAAASRVPPSPRRKEKNS